MPASSHPRSPPESVNNNRIRWNAPLDGIFKINFDITIPKEVSQAHCRESKGHVLVATMKLLESILEPREVEAYAFWWKILQDADLLLSNACYETDCLQLFQQWKKRDEWGWGESLFHGIIVDRKMMLANSLHGKIFYLPKEMETKLLTLWLLYRFLMMSFAGLRRSLKLDQII